MILDERTFSNFEDWADQINLILGKYGTVPTIISYRDWDRWAFAVVQFPQVSGQNPPAPQLYQDWRSWAKAFNQTVNLNAT